MSIQRLLRAATPDLAFAGLLIGTVLLVSAGTAWSNVIFTDGTFNPANYSATPVYTSDPSVVLTATQCGSCGNPGDALQVNTTFGASNATVFFGFVNTTFTYNPVTQGAIVSIAASIDRNITLSDSGTHTTTFNLLIEQDGNFFKTTVASATYSGESSGWLTLAGSDIVAADFSEIDFTTGVISAGTPNFNGDLMEFGTFGFSPGNGPHETADIISDNLEIDLAVPEPSTVTLLASGLLAVGAVRRRRRKPV